MDIFKSILAGFMVGVGVLAAQWWLKRKTLARRIRLHPPEAGTEFHVQKARSAWVMSGTLVFRLDCIEAVPDTLTRVSVEMLAERRWVSLCEAIIISEHPFKGASGKKLTPSAVAEALTTEKVQINGYDSKAVNVHVSAELDDLDALEVTESIRKATLRLVCCFVSASEQATPAVIISARVI